MSTDQDDPKDRGLLWLDAKTVRSVFWSTMRPDQTEKVIWRGTNATLSGDEEAQKVCRDVGINASLSGDVAEFDVSATVITVEVTATSDVHCSAEVLPPKAISNVDDPPRVAEFFLALLLSEANVEAAIGDLSEHFEKDCQRFGAGRARRMYWASTLRSLWPLLRRAAVRALKWGVIIESVRRYLVG